MSSQFKSTLAIVLVIFTLLTVIAYIGGYDPTLTTEKYEEALAIELGIEKENVIYDSKNDTFYTDLGTYKVNFNGNSVEKIVEINN